MELTAEQLTEIARQREAAPESRSFRITMTPAQRKQYRAAIAEELAAKQVNIAHLYQLEQAEQEPTLSGVLRQAISTCGRSTEELSHLLQISPDALTRFRTGEQALSSDVIDELIKVLDLDIILADGVN